MRDGTAEARGDAVTARLRLLATTDLHGHLLPYDYHADRPRPAMGLAQAARLVRSFRDEAPGGACLLLDNGDFLLGSLMSDLLPGGGDGPHPVIAAMNALGYDAGTLGNHEFDHGLAPLQAALAGAAFPILSANILLRDGTPLAAPWTVLPREVRGSDGRRHPLRIGVLGLAPPQLARWNALALGGALRTRDILDAARQEIPRLRAAGAEIVVALCHSGTGPEAPEPGMENAAIPLAALPGIDALVLGHTHRAFPGPGWVPTSALDPASGTLHGKPAVQPGFHGSHVGLLDLHLRRGPEGWRVAAHRAEAVPVPPETRPDRAVTASTAPAHRRLLALARQPVGCTRIPLQSYFSRLASDAALDIVADAQRQEARRLIEGRPEAALPILSTVAPFRAGGRAGPTNYIDIPPGPLALRQAAGLYVHSNSLCLLEITGAGLRDWLERSAAMFRTLAPGAEDQPLLDPAFPSYNFDTIDGLTWEIDLARPPRTDAEGRILDPAASRVRDLHHDGRPVTAGDRFLLATNSYRLGGGGAFAPARAARLVLSSPVPVRDLVLAHVRAAPVDPARRPRWRFAALPGTSAWFDSGPGAMDHLATVEGRDIDPLGPALEGFLRFRLRL